MRLLLFLGSFSLLASLAACSQAPSGALRTEVRHELERQERLHETYLSHNDAILGARDTLKQRLTAALGSRGFGRLANDREASNRFELLMQEHAQLLNLHRAFLQEHKASIRELHKWLDSFDAAGLTHQEAVQRWDVYKADFEQDAETEAGIMRSFQSWRSSFVRFIREAKTAYAPSPPPDSPQG